MRPISKYWFCGAPSMRVPWSIMFDLPCLCGRKFAGPLKTSKPQRRFSMAGLSTALAFLFLATAQDSALAFLSSAPGQQTIRQRSSSRPVLQSSGNNFPLDDGSRRLRRRTRWHRPHGGQEAGGPNERRSPRSLRPLQLTPSSSSSSSSPFSVEELAEISAAEEIPAHSPPGSRVAVLGGSSAHAQHGGGHKGVVHGKAAAAMGVFEVAAARSTTTTAATATATPPAAPVGRGVFSEGARLRNQEKNGDSRIQSLGERALDPSDDSISTGQLSVLVAMAALMAVAVDYEHGMAGFHWFHHWAGDVASAPHGTSATDGDGLGHAVHLTPLKSITTGLGAGITRAASRTFTFPLDTIKTRRQLSRLGTEDRALLPDEMRRIIEGPASFKGMFKGFSAFLVQAGPSNAAFFLFYDALNALGAATILGGGASCILPPGSFLPSAVHLGASSVATVPANLLRTPAELVKQRLQVGQVSGNALEALLSIVRADGVRGLFVGGKEQLIREIPFNAVQFTVYECLKSSVGLSSELWADAALGAASSAIGAIATQPVDTVKTRVMTKSVPGSFGGKSPGFLESASQVAEAEGVSSLFLGMLPRLVLVSTGGAFYFWGQAFVAQLMGRAGF